MPLTAETCSLCHGKDKLAETNLHDSVVAVSLARGSATILTADFTPAGAVVKPTITFQVRTSTGAFLEDPANTALNGGWGAFNFTIAKLVPEDAAQTTPEHWQNFINPAPAPYYPSREVGGNKISGVNGTLSYDAATHTYTYKYAVDIAAVTTPIAVPFAAGDVIRFGFQVTNYTSGTPVYDMTNGAGDFTSTTGLVATPDPLHRQIVTTAACNACHGKLAIHGRRVETDYCVTCHNLALVDANSPARSGDLTVYIHQLHGRQVVSTTNTLAGLVPQEITYPQDVRNCATCHKGTEGARWNTNPSRYACTSCHDTISFVSPAPAGKTVHSGGARADDSACAGCHDAAAIQSYHVIPAIETAKKFAYLITATTNTVPGQNPVVTFMVIDPTSTGCTPATGAGCATYDVKNDVAFKNGARLAIDIGWATTDIQNVGTNSTYGQPISINAITASTAVAGTNTFQVTSPVPVPLTMTGSGVVAFEGHPVVSYTTPGGVTSNVSPAVLSVSKAFPITDKGRTGAPSAVPRRTIVDITKCNACHVRLVLHGSNRTGDIGTCTICHNTEATDAIVRTDTTGAPLAASNTIDGKVSEGIDFKYMIHGIHARNIVVYGFKFSPTIPPNPVDYREVTYPNFLNNCQACHTATGYVAPADAANGTTVTDGADKLGNADNLRTTKWKATCGQCHTGLASVHIEQMGGTTGVTQGQIDALVP
jgi:OmcA/MtrC family decaheme c-type cytochrome